jgi:hypothetical protein
MICYTDGKMSEPLYIEPANKYDITIIKGNEKALVKGLKDALAPP